MATVPACRYCQKIIRRSDNGFCTDDGNRCYKEWFASRPTQELASTIPPPPQPGRYSMEGSHVDTCAVPVATGIQLVRMEEEVRAAAKRGLLVVWKYALGVGVAVRQMPNGAKVLSAGFVLGEVVVWALVDTEQIHDLRPRTFRIALTGQTFAPWVVREFIGTAVMSNGIVVHVFEEQSER